MKNSLKSLVAVVALAGLSVAAYAQAPKILVVDMARLYDNHYKTVDYNAKIQADGQKAEEEIGRMRQEHNKLTTDYEKFVKDNNIVAVAQDGRIQLDPKAAQPSFASEEKKKQMFDDLQKETIERIRAIMGKRQEIEQYGGQTEKNLRERLLTFRNVMLDDISKTASEIARRKGATILIDKSIPTAVGIPTVIFVDGSIDITEEVLKELNKDRPANLPAPTSAPAAAGNAPAPSGPAAPAPASNDAPRVQFPGTPVKK